MNKIKLKKIKNKKWNKKEENLKKILKKNYKLYRSGNKNINNI